jgi:hypothetical protein
MRWKRNALKAERIARLGVTADTPLFGGAPSLPEPPTRILDRSDVKARAIAMLQDRLPETRLKVFDAIFDLEAATDREIAERLGWEINRVTGRRKELQQLGFIEPCGEKPGRYGAANTLWRINNTYMRILLP